MLSLEWMGVLALGILWVNMGLTVAAAGKAWRGLGAWATKLRRGVLEQGVVREGRGGRGELASRESTLIARAVVGGSRRAMQVVESGVRSAVAGGTVQVGERVLDVPAGGLYWTIETRSMPSEFDAHWGAASTAKGARIDRVDRLSAGTPVWVWRDGDETVISIVDPRGVVASAARRMLALILGVTALTLLTTLLALWPPTFGLVSTLGGALGIAVFLGVAPVAVQMHEAARLPHEQLFGGLWRDAA